MKVFKNSYKSIVTSISVLLRITEGHQIVYRNIFMCVFDPMIHLRLEKPSLLPTEQKVYKSSVFFQIDNNNSHQNKWIDTYNDRKITSSLLYIYIYIYIYNDKFTVNFAYRDNKIYNKIYNDVFVK